ncbi:MAG: hypothetical protein KC496_17040 [Anaerolineae bacterium]|nr:hypothetical protein [Anaerolineae bacterium]
MSLRRIIAGKQSFTRIHPAPARDGIDEYDLFEGVTLTEEEPEPVA